MTEKKSVLKNSKVADKISNTEHTLTHIHKHTHTEDNNNNNKKKEKKNKMARGCDNSTTCKIKCPNPSNKFLMFTQKCRYLSTAAIFLITFNLLLSLSPCNAFLLDGSQNSFAQFRKWYTGLNGSLEFEFKTEQPNGLILYTDDGGTFDFFEIKLVEGAVRLRYNLGGGANIITVGRELHDGHWHKVQVRKLYTLFQFFRKKNNTELYKN